MTKTLNEIHEDVPEDHYDQGIKHNLFQKYWHYRRFKEVLNVAKKVDGPMLDIGCHSGIFTEKIIKNIDAKKVYGIDISKVAIQGIKKRIPFGHFENKDAVKLPYKDNFFDAVFCLEMLEHVEYPKKVISEIKRVLKKGGYGVILVPTDNRLFKIIWALWTTKYHVWKHTHVQSFANTSLEDLVTNLGLKIELIKKFNLGMLKLVTFVKLKES